MPEYFLVLLFWFFLGMLLQHRYRLRLYKSPKHLACMNLLYAVIGIAWDQFAISRGHWSFGEQFLLGPKIEFMPIEEFGFIFIVPYFLLVLYKLVEKKVDA